MVALFGILLLSSCHRPNAYFQPAAAYRADPPASAPLKMATADDKAPTEQLAQANATLAQVDAYVRNDQQLATNERLTHHLNRARNILASPHKIPEPNATNVAGPSARNTLMGRLLVTKINRQLGKRLAPNHPEKTMLAHRGQLIGGLVLLIGGLILLIAGTGTVAFIGLILSLIGALGVILGFFGQ